MQATDFNRNCAASPLYGPACGAYMYLGHSKEEQEEINSHQQHHHHTNTVDTTATVAGAAGFREHLYSPEFWAIRQCVYSLNRDP